MVINTPHSYSTGTGCRLPTPPPQEVSSEEGEISSVSATRGKGRNVLLAQQNLDLKHLFDNKDEYKWACVEANNRVFESGRPNIDGERIPLVTQWDFTYLSKKLVNFPNPELIDLLKYGFPIECNESCSNMSKPDNQAGAKCFPDELDAYIAKHLHDGTLIGPFSENRTGTRACISPLNTIAKKDRSERRVLMDLSFPEGNAVNSGIDKDHYRGEQVTLTLPNVDSLLKLIYKKKGKVMLFKCDLKCFYKQIAICIGDIHLMGCTHRGQYYFDLTLPMGLTNSAMIYDKVSSMFMYIFKIEGHEGLNYLDDLAGAENELIADQAFSVLQDILACAGAKESLHKACSPSTRMLFLGILIDTILMQIEIDPERMAEIRGELLKWLGKHDTTLHQLHQLVGKLNFCASAVRSGRLFFSCILNFLRTFKGKEVKVLPKQVKLDIFWWFNCMKEFNGISKIPPCNWSGPNKMFSVDACGDAMGGWAEGEFFHARFPEEVLQLSSVGINELELFTIMIGLKLWGHRVANCNFLVQCDNEVAVRVLNTGAARNEFSQQILREICFINARNDSYVKAIHLPANQNRLADALSRWERHPKYKIRFEKMTAGLVTREIKVHPNVFKFTNLW